MFGLIVLFFALVPIIFLFQNLVSNYGSSEEIVVDEDETLT